MDITQASLDLFIAYAKDGPNWSGTPLVGRGGNVSKDEKAERGNITQLKRAKLITTFTYERCLWMKFTPAGEELAKKHGILDLK